MGRVKKRDEPRRCFVVVSWEGCFAPDLCQSKHVIVDCEVHGTLAHVENEDTGRLIMGLHMKDPTWPIPEAPLTEAALERILATKEHKRDTIFVPSTYKG